MSTSEIQRHEPTINLTNSTVHIQKPASEIHVGPTVVSDVTTNPASVTVNYLRKYCYILVAR